MAALRLVVARSDTLAERIAALSRGGQWYAFSWLAAITAHGSLAVLLARAPVERREPRQSVMPTFELEPERPRPEPEPEPEPVAEPPPREPQEPSRPAARAETPKLGSPARAATALQQSAVPEQAVDFTDELVMGSSASYAGGMTTSAGIGALAARPGAGNGIGARSTGGEGEGARDALDRSHPASVRGGLDWKCPFPPEADSDGVDRAVVTIRIELDRTGRTTRVSIVNDPGHGFGQAARRCALGKGWSPALDRAGNPAAASVLVAVRFVR